MEKLFVKNMVCDRCSLVVRQELDKLGIKPANVALGLIELPEPLTNEQFTLLKSALEHTGFELLDDKKSMLIEKIKTLVIQHIHHGKDKEAKSNYSDFLAKETGKDYSYISGLFSDIEGITIEHYIITQKIERVKELLVYDELNLSEIAMSMGYSSVAHLSNQFKKNTGLTPTHFKKVGLHKRRAIDTL